MPTRPRNTPDIIIDRPFKVKKSAIDNALRALGDNGSSLDRIEFSNTGFTVFANGHGKTAARSGLLTIDQARAYGPMSRSKIYRLIRARKLIIKKDGGRTLVVRASIDRYLKTLPTKLLKRSAR